MGDRIKDGLCVNCGSVVLVPNDWHCCSQCVEEVKARALQKIRNIGSHKKIVLPGVPK